MEMELKYLLPVIEEKLNNGQSVKLSPMGTSMLPMLRQGTDAVVLSPVTGKLKKYDIPFYRRDNGKFVLHRIVEAGDTYSCMGDNQFVIERNVRHDQVIAYVSGFYRKDTYYNVNNPVYLLYCRVWYNTRRIRRFFKRAVNWIRRHVR